jgi:hypothetical protein
MYGIVKTLQQRRQPTTPRARRVKLKVWFFSYREIFKHTFLICMGETEVMRAL